MDELQSRWLAGCSTLTLVLRLLVSRPEGMPLFGTSCAALCTAWALHVMAVRLA